MPDVTHTIYGRTYKSADALKQRLTELDRQHAGKKFPDNAKAEWNALQEALEDSELEVRQAWIAECAARPENRERAFDDDRVAAQATTARDGAMRTIERHVNAGSLNAAAADRVDEVLRKGDAGFGLDARYVETHGSEDYERAFHKLLRYGDGAAMRMTPDEMTAVQKANRAEELRTAMAEGTGSTGGFGIPIAIDPTINLSSSGVLNPIRQLATVRTMSTRELRLVASDGVVAQYQAEAAEAIDNSPTLTQPVLTAQRCTSFVPFSWEVDQDWGSLANELTQLVADAKDVVEATKFLSGSGTNEPVGLLTIGTTGALTTSQRIQTAGAGAIVIGDVYALKQGIGNTRFMGNATWTMHPNRLDSCSA